MGGLINKRAVSILSGGFITRSFQSRLQKIILWSLIEQNLDGLRSGYFWFGWLKLLEKGLT